MKNKVEIMVKAYVKMRDALGERRKEFKAFEARMKKDMDKIAIELMATADAVGVESFKTEYGTAFKKTSDFVAVKDWSKALDYIVKYDLVNMFNKSVNKTAVKEFMAENNNMLPPGLEFGQKVEIQVRRS